MRKIQIASNSKIRIFRSVYSIDMKFHRQLRPATKTSWVVSYVGKTIPRWRTAAILKIDISPYLSEQELSYRKQIARQLRTQFVEGISVTLKSRLRVTQGHWERNHCTDHTRLTIRRVIGRWILSWPWNVGQRSLKVIEISAIRKLGCGFLFAFYSNCGRICSRLGDIQCHRMAWPWKPG